MVRARAWVPIGMSAVILAAAIVVPAIAVTQAGPLHVTDTTDPYAIQGQALSNGAGVEGLSNGGWGLYGYNNNGAKPGVYGVSTALGGLGVEGSGYAAGVSGHSTKQNGVLGITSTTGASFAGVVGRDQSTGGGINYGVLGTGHSVGVEGNAGIIGVRGMTSGGLSIGVVGTSVNGGGVLGGASGSSNAVGVTAVTDGTALAMQAVNSGAKGNIMSLDASGNMILAGTLTQSGTPLSVVRGSGPARVAYSAQLTTPALEDAGEGRIAGGVGYVAIDPGLASTLDPRAPYSVFLQPEGDSRGLYVIGKSARGFFVRESMGGRSSIAFSYRILGRPASARGERLPLYSEDRRFSTVRASALLHLGRAPLGAPR